MNHSHHDKTAYRQDGDVSKSDTSVRCAMRTYSHTGGTCFFPRLFHPIGQYPACWGRSLCRRLRCECSKVFLIRDVTEICSIITQLSRFYAITALHTGAPVSGLAAHGSLFLHFSSRLLLLHNKDQQHVSKLCARYDRVVFRYRAPTPR